MISKALTKSMKNTVKHVLSNTFFTRNEVLVDLSHRCPIECPKCQRQIFYTNLGKKVVGHDMPMSTIEKLTDRFTGLCFGGQLSDPIHHPKFLDILELCKKKGILTKVQTASSFKSFDWYRRAFETYPKAKWQFGIDGLPKQSKEYRINQDGEKLYEVMLMSKKYLETKPIWQCIVFKYNQDYLEEIEQMAKDNDIELVIMYSARWDKGHDPYKPTRSKRLEHAEI